jgi:hypothetical protein
VRNQPPEINIMIHVQFSASIHDYTVDTVLTPELLARLASQTAIQGVERTCMSYQYAVELVPVAKPSPTTPFRRLA